MKSNLDLIVLRFLRTRPRWGYEINLAVRDRFGVFLSAGTLYPLLHTLEDNGYVEGVWEADKGRGRRIYKITELGLSFLSAGERVAAELAKAIQSDFEDEIPLRKEDRK